MYKGHEVYKELESSIIKAVAGSSPAQDTN